MQQQASVATPIFHMPATTAAAIAVTEAASTERDQATSSAIVDLTNRMLNSVEASFIALAQAVEEYEVDTPQTPIDIIKQTLIADITTIIETLKKYSTTQTQADLINEKLEALHRELITLITTIHDGSDIHKAVQLYTAILITYNKQPYLPLEKFVTTCLEQFRQAETLLSDIHTTKQIPGLAWGKDALKKQHTDRDRRLEDQLPVFIQHNAQIIAELQHTWEEYAQAVRHDRTILTSDYEVNLDINPIRARRTAPEQNTMTAYQASIYLKTPSNLNNLTPLQDYLNVLRIRMQLLKDRFYAQTAPNGYSTSLLSDHAQQCLQHIRSSIDQAPQRSVENFGEFFTALPANIRKITIDRATDTVYNIGTTTALPLITISNQLTDQMQGMITSFNIQLQSLLQSAITTTQTVAESVHDTVENVEDQIHNTTQETLIKTLSITQDAITKIMQPREDLSYIPMQALRAGHALTDNNPYVIVEQLRTTLVPLSHMVNTLTKESSGATNQALDKIKNQLQVVLNFAENNLKQLDTISNTINNLRKELNKVFIGLIKNPQIHRTIYATITSRYANQNLLHTIGETQKKTQENLLQKRAAFNAKMQTLHQALQKNKETHESTLQEELPALNDKIKQLAQKNSDIKQIEAAQADHIQAITELKNKCIAIKKTSWIHSATNPLHWIFQKLSWIGYGKGIAASIWRALSPYGRTCLMIKKHEKEINNNILRLNDLKEITKRLKLEINSYESTLQTKSNRCKKINTTLAQYLEKNRSEREKLELKNRYIQSQIQEEQANEASRYYARRPE